jgi:hypothetical protein
MIGIAVSIDVDDVARRCDRTLPVRSIAAYLGAVVAINALSELLDGMGIATVPTYVQDLAFWLPLLTIGAWLLWHRRPWGFLIAGAGLAFWTVEAATVAVDQWFGHRADPWSDVASNAMVVPFAVMAAVGAGALWSFLRHVDTNRRQA